ncbi:hypothetical protein M7I_5790 [Glarea lozoyensis 74030]|uniref:Uncharacterized protein n=1 Tax=Glarea lozoyensis (strain ATCC 74030 / MF5533) TaxID=1104152 RepID=H0ESU3_GLAL7|nr:hypothetical protein M7I_5790 [Glarea lozoyensis 74030]
MVLRNKTGNDPPWGEYERAEELCELGTKWDIEGFIRLEAGFELILCNFTNGLEFKSARRRPKQDPNQFEYMRAVAARYQGITAGRVEVDYSSMVSAFFYPINLTNPNPKRAELPRLVSSEVGGVRHIQEDLEIVLESSQRFSNERIDWQGVVDMIVTRYSDRLQYMVLETTTQEEIQATVSTLLSLLIEEESPAVETAKLEMKDLIAYLDWSTWLECGKCAYDELQEQ